MPLLRWQANAGKMETHIWYYFLAMRHQYTQKETCKAIQRKLPWSDARQRSCSHITFNKYRKHLGELRFLNLPKLPANYVNAHFVRYGSLVRFSGCIENEATLNFRGYVLQYTLLDGMFFMFLYNLEAFRLYEH